MATLSARVEKARRIVVKIGSSLLTEGNDGTVREAWLAALADDVAALRAQGKQVMLVSSGAIAVGRQCLGMMRKTTARLASQFAQEFKARAQVAS